jgi:hypothetical protein
MTIKVFYHICPIQHALTVVKEHMLALHYSGLYDAAQGVYCFLAGGTEEVATEVRRFLQTSGAKVHIMEDTRRDISYERLTLLAMHDMVEPKDVVLYLHSKGVTGRTPEEVERKTDWNRVLSYHAIKQFRTCVDAIRAGYDLAGPNYDDRGIYPLHFSGNIWWASGTYYKTLPRFIGEGYLDPEFYVCQNKPHVFIQHRTWEDHHANTYKMNRYVDT